MNLRENSLSDTYYRPDANEILQEYIKAVDLLTINEENRLRRRVKILEVKADKIHEWEYDGKGKE